MKLRIFIKAIIIVTISCNILLAVPKATFDEINKVARGEKYFLNGYYQDALDMFRQAKNDTPNNVKILTRVGECLFWLGNTPLALSEFETLKEKATALNSKEDIANVVHNVGEIYREEKKYNMAMEKINEAISLNLEITNDEGLGANYASLAKIYSSTREFNKSILYFDKALRIKKQLKDFLGIAIILNDQGLMFYYQEEFDQAKDYFNTSLQYFDKVGHEGLKSRVYNNLGAIAIKDNDYDKALNYFEKAKDVDVRTKDNGHYGLVLVNIAVINEKQGKIKSALSLIEEAIKIYREHNLNFDLFSQYQKYLEDLL